MKNTECFGEREKTIHLEKVIIMKNAKKLIPGAAIALVIAVAAKFLESLEESAGLHFIGASVIAMFIGMIVNAFYKPNSVTAPGIKFTSKKILKFAIILLGASLNIRTVLTVGRFSLTVMVFTLATCFGLGALIGKAMGLVSAAVPRSRQSRRSSRRPIWTLPMASPQRFYLIRS